MVRDADWNDYLEPELDGPEVHCVYRCPKCGFQEVMPDSTQLTTCPPSIICPKCKSRMYEDAES